MSTATATRRAWTAAAEAARIVIYARISDDKALIKAGMAGRNVGEQVDDAIMYAARVLGLDPSTAVEAGTLTGKGKAARWVPNLAAADALVIVTEWKEFRSPDFDYLKKTLKAPVVFDGRNLYDPIAMKKLGFKYYAIGRGEASPG